MGLDAESELAVTLLGSAVRPVAPRPFHGLPRPSTAVRCPPRPPPACTHHVTDNPVASRPQVGLVAASHPLALTRIHGIRLVSHVRSLGARCEWLRDELENGVLLDELRRGAAEGGVDMEADTYPSTSPLPPPILPPRPPPPTVTTALLLPLAPPQTPGVLQPPGPQTPGVLQPPGTLPAAHPQPAQAPSIPGVASTDRMPSSPAKSPTTTSTPSALPPTATPAPGARQIPGVTGGTLALVPSATPSAVDAPSAVRPGGGSQQPGAESQRALPPAPPSLPREAIQQAIQSIFDQWDLDHSGTLTRDEFASGILHEAANSPPADPSSPVQIITAAMARQAAGLPSSGSQVV